MRQGQQNRRGRGRGRKVQNPLSRNYESNGPEVKIRGNAAHVAEKYSSLARDALVSGDTVTAENYLQHAEHYYRIIMAAQAQTAAQGAEVGEGANGSGGQRQQPADKTADSVAVQPEAPVNGKDAEVPASESAGDDDGDAGKAAGKKDGKEAEEDPQASDDAPPDNAAA